MARAAWCPFFTGSGRATSLPGKVLMRLDPRALERLSARLERGSVVISATNGKTTTAGMAATILSKQGHRLVHNRAGANMTGGIVSTLLDAAGTRGSMSGELGLFEVDEFWLDQVTDALRPRGMVTLATLPRSARPLRGARGDRRSLGRGAGPQCEPGTGPQRG